MEYKTSKGVTFAYSPLIDVPHGFSTRLGGVSEAAHTSALNLAFGRGDERETVLRNLALFAAAVGVDEKSIISAPQIHSAIVRRVSAADAGRGYFTECDFSCDGYITTERGVTLGVKTADCVPILTCAKRGGETRAVCALHAGWRGTSARIVEAALGELFALGFAPSDIYAAIGPSIGSCCYEVGEDFYAAFDAQLRERFVIPTENGKYRADLRAANLALFESAGVPRQNVDVSEDCTYCRADLYYSHRRQNGIRGSMLSVIAL